MGILGHIVKNYVIEKTVLGIGSKVFDNLDKKSEEKIKKSFEKPNGTQVLVISRNHFSWNDKFDIYDEYQNIKYSVKGEFISIKPNLNIFDNKGQKIASVKEKIISLRSPISMETKPVDFILEIGGRKIGKVKSKWAFAKQSYHVDFNGWRIDGNFLGWNYKIFNGNKIIANITQELFNSSDTYIINFIEPKDELIIIMLVLAMASLNRR